MSPEKVGRREALGVMGAAGAALAFGCGGSKTTPSDTVNNTVHRSGVYASRGANPISNLSDGILADSLIVRDRHSSRRCVGRLSSDIPGQRVAVKG